MGMHHEEGTWEINIHIYMYIYIYIYIICAVRQNGIGDVMMYQYLK
jgi:hypothetical protein